MKKAFLFAFILTLSTLIFAQSNKNDAESDSLFKVFLQKSKGIKFEEHKTQKKDTISSTSSSATQTTTKNKEVKAVVVKADTVNLAKPASQSKKDSAVAVKKDIASIPPTSVKTEAKAGLHKFKDYNNTYALEAERKGPVVKLYLKMDDIEQYAEVILVRSQAELGNFSDVRHIQVIKGANKFEYVETEDRYPLPTKVAAAYKIRAITKDGAIRTFPAITLEPGNK